MTLPAPDPRLLAALSPLDRRFAETLGRLAPDTSPWVLLAAALTSRALDEGHSCLDLAHADALLLPDESPLAISSVHFPGTSLPQPAPLALLPTEVWLPLLRGSALVTEASEASPGADLTPAPLVLTAAPDGTPRLHLWRYFDFQRRLAAALRARRAHRDPLSPEDLEARLAPLFPPAHPGDGPDLQREAVATALTRRLAVIAGGPGTGKTTTVARLLAALLAGPEWRDRAPAIALTAPTGKAAARLSEAIRDGLEHLPIPDALRARIPTRAETLHRLLARASQAAGGGRSRSRDGLRISVDLLVIDEASMVDLALMTRVTEALRPEARLVLLGDKDQLASVEAGRVLIDLIHAARPEGPLAGHVVELTRTHRFGATIGTLADAIRRGDVTAALACLEAPEPSPVRWLDLRQDGILDFATNHWAPFFSALETPTSALDALSAFQLLTAHRTGPYGAEQLAAALRLRFAEAGLIPGHAWEPWFHGRTVLIQHNDAPLGLFNGDIGVTLPDPADGRPRVHFRVTDPDDPRPLRSLGPGQLPGHAAPWAMTVHKAQGSGYDHVAICLPPEPTPACTRELLYTAVTRARHRVTILATRESLVHAIATPTERTSGLTAETLR